MYRTWKQCLFVSKLLKVLLLAFTFISERRWQMVFLVQVKIEFKPEDHTEDTPSYYASFEFSFLLSLGKLGAIDWKEPPAYRLIFLMETEAKISDALQAQVIKRRNWPVENLWTQGWHCMLVTQLWSKETMGFSNRFELSVIIRKYPGGCLKGLNLYNGVWKVASERGHGKASHFQQQDSWIIESLVRFGTVSTRIDQANIADCDDQWIRSTHSKGEGKWGQWS